MLTIKRRELEFEVGEFSDQIDGFIEEFKDLYENGFFRDENNKEIRYKDYLKNENLKLIKKGDSLKITYKIKENATEEEAQRYYNGGLLINKMISTVSFHLNY